MAGVKPFSQACVNNRRPILDILLRVFSDCREVLEIGSGTGQHAVFFAPALPHLAWQPSDQRENLAGIHAWVADEPSPNLAKPLELDVDRDWPQRTFDGFFTANTCHIMPWRSVVNLFAGIGERAGPEAVLAVYGPFRYRGEYTSASNASFDRYLREVASHQGIREIDDIVALAQEAGFAMAEDNAMPANNQLLIFRKPAKP